ncbi:VCBS repeat-containing protein [Candidatus Gracilibacteria bacterium]|nr:VCBS repeat-containing protein [Candidatus Gracilibacteria bacterium]
MNNKILVRIIVLGLFAASIAPRTLAAPLNANFILQWQADELTDTLSIAWGDINGDGRADLALGNAPLFDSECGCLVAGENQLYLSEGVLLASTPAWQSESGEFTTGIALEDLDGDGKRDLVSANAFFGAESVCQQRQRPTDDRKLGKCGAACCNAADRAIPHQRKCARDRASRLR